LSKNFKLKQLWEIYLTFLKLGSVSFGGGYAILSLIELEVVDRKKWIDKEKIIDIFSVSQSLPGAIALNSSAFAGYSISGIPGAIAALLGNLTPSVLIMFSLSALFAQFSENIYVQKAFNGIRPVIVGLITYAAFKIGKTAIKDIYCILIALAALALALVVHIPVIYIILSGIVTGFIYWFITFLTQKDKLNKQAKDGE
jgi:chromate transporter